jgi:hypothetical protein
VHPAPVCPSLQHAQLDGGAGVEERLDAFPGGEVAAGVDALDGLGAAGVVGAGAGLVDLVDTLLVQGRLLPKGPSYRLPPNARLVRLWRRIRAL